MTGELAGKTALVTGGTRGIGRGIAERLAQSGALVAVNYAAKRQAADQAVAAIAAAGGTAFAIEARIGAPDAIAALVAALDAELARRTGSTGLDILINNAGGGDLGTIESTSTELFDRTFANNVRAPFLLTQALLPRLRDGGRVINISSAAARRANPDTIAYAMAKGAIEVFTRALAQQLGPRRIAVNSVGPGFVETEMSAKFLEDPAVVGELERQTAFGRLGRVSDIADLVHALASPAGVWVTEYRGERGLRFLAAECLRRAGQGGLIGRLIGEILEPSCLRGRRTADRGRAVL